MRHIICAGIDLEKKFNAKQSGETIMQIQFTGHNIEVTDALKNLITEKLEKIHRHFNNIISTHVTLRVEHVDNKAEVTVQLPGHPVHATGTADDMYKAIDQMIHALDTQVIKIKEKMKSHRD